ncbi:DUF3299 domain-containing protein [Exilibacterium tricleocarpae]|uniref:DUF3299 domain-containing protein n=2 Tax=Exilibacterium tricleocarpae TaxID=2591008 RepID=A0A545T053_9GAMM|nr:DUF3299 domain-containing protein [Exilibacterium tricleocarpae]
MISLNACDNTGPPEQLPGVADPEDNIQEAFFKLGEKEKPIAHIAAGKKLPKSAFKTIEWTDLMPKEDLDALLNPPGYVTDIEDGSVEEQISSQIQNTIAAASDDRYQQALVSTRVVPKMNGQAIRIPGFIVPLEFDDEQTITQFFLVPFFGACIHLPPPPPNQIVFVDYPEGLKLTALYDPFWVSGVVETSLTENDIATAAYSLKMQYFEEYTD